MFSRDYSKGQEQHPSGWSNRYMWAVEDLWFDYLEEKREEIKTALEQNPDIKTMGEVAKIPVVSDTLSGAFQDMLEKKNYELSHNQVGIALGLMVWSIKSHTSTEDAKKHYLSNQ